MISILCPSQPASPPALLSPPLENDLAQEGPPAMLPTKASLCWSPALRVTHTGEKHTGPRCFICCQNKWPMCPISNSLCPRSGSWGAPGCCLLRRFHKYLLSNYSAQRVAAAARGSAVLSSTPPRRHCRPATSFPAGCLAEQKS